MSPALRLLLVALAGGVLLDLFARRGPGRWAAWARRVVTWSGLLAATQAAVALASALFTPAHDEPLLDALARIAASALCIGGGFVTAGHLAEAVARRFAAPRWLRHGLVLVSSVPGALAGYALYLALQALVGGGVPFWAAEDGSLSALFNALAFWFVGNVAAMVGVVRLLYDLRFDAVAEAARRFEAEAAAARLQALEGQLRPHVLFNALSGLAGLIGQDPPRAEAMTLALARLLRRTLDAPQAPTVPLRDELAFAQDYLDVERCRLGDRLRVAVDADPAALDVPVPRLVLQPLVENAVKHGAGGRTGDVAVRLVATRTAHALRLAVEDDGPPFADGWMAGTGLGSVRERLALLYGDRAALAVHDAPKAVSVTLPLS